MKKDCPINFRASSDLRDALLRVAQEDRRSLSSTIEIILSNYLDERKTSRGQKRDKRQYPREALSVPAVFNQEDSGQVGIGAVTEISLGGIGIIIPKDFKQSILIDAHGSKFEIVFNLPNENKPIKLACESKRVIDENDSTRIGASFINGDFQSYQTLQNYLM